MTTPTRQNDRLAMLLACGSPGSAAAYHDISHQTGADLVQRDKSLAVTPQAAAPAGFGFTAWIGRLIRPLHESRWEQELREREAYLSRSQNVFDVEVRMRALEDAALGRSRALG